MKSLKIWKLAKKKILSGNSLLSKKPELFLPKFWPTYYKKAKKLHVWDLENKKYLDMIFAVGQNTLGYSNKFVDRAVQLEIKNGNICSLNSLKEVEMAKLLLSLHKWADKAKFAKSGGEANAIAIRIARSSCKNNDNVAISGYHGWHDWYLSVNLSGKEKLKDHLLPGLEPIGVPKKLRNTVFPFQNGNIDQLYKIYKKNGLGVVKMEIARSHMPDEKFLEEVRDFCDRKKIVLIFDECTSGFRNNLGGIHLLTKIRPDIAMFGKAMGNGYPITAVIGKEKFMNAAKKSFISSTFWSESIGFAAGIATIKYMKNNESYKTLIKNGNYIKKRWEKLGLQYELNLDIGGIGPISSFNFKNSRHQLYKTFITQEMLKYGYLASNLIYLTIHHNKKVIDEYSYYLEKVFKKIKTAEIKKKYNNLLKGNVSVSTFQRLIK